MNTQSNIVRTQKRGMAVLQDPLLNKGSAFTLDERKELGLLGLLPPHVSTPAEQVERTYNAITSSEDQLERYVSLLALQDRNEHLFYRLLGEHMAEFMPVVYTPTVGLACQRYSHVFQRARGIWIDPGMRGNMAAVLKSAVRDHTVKLIVATDNESILGIGDQGAGGMAISVGKLALYVAGAGLHPGETLPVSLDVGTNNQELLDDALYLGWRAPRLTGSDYDSFIDEFVDAVREVFPEALLQWEDFRKDNAISINARHRSSLLSFNDDVQGTGAVTLAGLYSAMEISKTSWSDHRVVIHGAGAAGAGIANQIRVAMTLDGLSEVEASERIAVLDSRGLLVDDQAQRDAYKTALAWPLALATRYGMADLETRSLEDVVNLFKPTVLIGSSGQPGVFTQEIVQSFLGNCERPIVLPFSNPTSLSEATPHDVIHWTEGRALVAAGSPFAPVEYQGQTRVIGQGNNVFIFPGLGLGALACGCTRISDQLVSAASRALADTVSDDELARGLLFPDVARLQAVSLAVAQRVAEAAVAEGSAQHPARFDVWQPVYENYTTS